MNFYCLRHFQLNDLTTQRRIYWCKVNSSESGVNVEYENVEYENVEYEKVEYEENVKELQEDLL